MVKPKNPPAERDYITEFLQRVDEDHPIVATRYYVAEITPAYTDSGYYGMYHEQSEKRVSPFFDTKKDALDWFSEHEPDDGKRLSVVTQHKRRTVIEKWW